VDRERPTGVEPSKRYFTVCALTAGGERYYSAVSGYVNEAHLGGRLVYFPHGARGESAVRPIFSNSIYHKLHIRPALFALWLEADLKHRFDYAV